VKHDAALLTDDVEAAIHPGLTGICFPKTESDEQAQRLDAQVADMERRRGLPVGRIELFLFIESPRGLMSLEAITTASGRVRSITLGPEDYCLTLGIELSADGMELHYGVSKVVTACKAAGIAPMRLLGSIGDFRDLSAFKRAAARARDLGCEGASCIHPDQVTILNRVFAPPPEKVEYARAAVEAFEEGLKRGTASVNVGGKMVDIPVYRRAKLILERAAAIAEVEKRKADALARLE